MSAVIIEVGIVGGIKLTVGFFWNDPNNDGKFRFGEFLATALTNPICLFNVGGELSLFIKVFITLGISPFSVSFDFTLVEHQLLDFSLKPNCTPPPPKLGGTTDGVLYLFAGKFSSTAERGHSACEQQRHGAEETWVVRQVPAKPDPDGDGPKSRRRREGEGRRQALGITEDFDDDGGKITTVVLDGTRLRRDAAGDVQRRRQEQAVHQEGSRGHRLRRRRDPDGEGASYVDSGGGADQITTFDRTDLSKPRPRPRRMVAGGGGPDAHHGRQRCRRHRPRRQVPGFHDQGPITVKTAEGGDVIAHRRARPGQCRPARATRATTASDPGGRPDRGRPRRRHALRQRRRRQDRHGQRQPAGGPCGQRGHESLYRRDSTPSCGGKGGDRIKSGSADDTIYTGSSRSSRRTASGRATTPTIQPAARPDQNAVDTGTGDDTVYG